MRKYSGLIHYFDGRDGPYSDEKRRVIDAIRVIESKHESELTDFDGQECGECEGIGFFLTEDGEELMRFLAKLKVLHD